jgi:molybdate transport system substrate-binding protein
MRVRRYAFLAALAFAFAASATAGEVSVAVASNFTAPMQKIAAAFERDTGHRAILAVGSTGRFYAQVKNGAPFEVLLAADDETPLRLEQEGHAVTGTRFTYAVGRLVLWSASPGVVDGQGEVLRAGGFERLAIADPRVAPYGAAAMEAITRMQLPRGVLARIVQGESITQAYQFVATGNAQLGFVALSQVAVDGRIAKGSGWIVPAHLHAPIRQEAVQLAKGRGNPAALALLQYLRGETARAIVRSHGYEH